MYYLVFGFLGMAMAGFVYASIYNNSDWNPYAVWVVALTLATLAMYGLDKGLAKIGKVRTPEIILHLLAILGGFPGGWLGMVLFGHKTNFRKHPWFVPILFFSTFGHGLLTYYWFFRGS